MLLIQIEALLEMVLQQEVQLQQQPGQQEFTYQHK
jgi:hypothetical protein